MKRYVFFLMMSAFLLSFAQAFAADSADRGPKVSVELREVPLKDVLRAFAQEHGINLIVDDGISGTITVSLKEIPLWDAIETILKSKGYTYRVMQNGVITIVPISELVKKQEDLVMKEFKLKFIKVGDSSIGTIKEFKSERGQITIVSGTNTVIVSDYPEVIERIGQLIVGLDVEPVQVMIEARIVEVKSSYKRELGVDWSGQVAFGSSVNYTSDFGVNLPVTEAAGFLEFGLVKGGNSLNIRLSALEDSGAGKIVSSPRISVLENEEAEITSGEEIVISSTLTNNSAVGSVTTPTLNTLSAELKLTVTPRTIGYDRISLNVNTTRDEFDYSKVVSGIPPKLKRTAKTHVIINNGDTVVIGGIYTKGDYKSDKKVPFFAKIPVLGWLFKHELKKEDQTELMIFITPTIIKNAIDAPKSSDKKLSEKK